MRYGVTFKYTDKGAVGILGNKKTFIMTSSGGWYPDITHDDFQTPYLSFALKFLGITDIHFISAQGVDISNKAFIRTMNHARDYIDELIEDN